MTKIRIGRELRVKVDTSGKSKVVHSQEVLVVKPKVGITANAAQMASVTSSIEGALRDVPVESCRETKSGALVVKFPSKDNSSYIVFEPKKPKLKNSKTKDAH